MDLKIDLKPVQADAPALIDDKQIKALWGNVKDSKNVFADIDGKSYETFRQRIVESDAVFVLPFGYARFNMIEPYTQFHGVVWSKEVFRHFDLCNSILEWARIHNACKPVLAAAPIENGIIRFLTWLGFRELSRKYGNIGEYEGRYVVMMRVK